MNTIYCPFCGETDFDKPGLKSHLLNGDCQQWNETENIVRLFSVIKEDINDTDDDNTVL